jgi:hypothetical protein
VNVDDNSSPTHSYYGLPGAWTLDNVGEFSFLVWVREVTVGLESGRWAGFEAVEAGSTVVQGVLRLPGSDGAAVLDATGRRVSSPGALRAGVYFVVSGSGVRRVAVVR